MAPSQSKTLSARGSQNSPAGRPNSTVSCGERKEFLASLKAHPGSRSDEFGLGSAAPACEGSASAKAGNWAKGFLHKAAMNPVARLPNSENFLRRKANELCRARAPGLRPPESFEAWYSESKRPSAYDA